MNHVTRTHAKFPGSLCNANRRSQKGVPKISRESKMESSLAILKKDVECSLCQDTLIEPKLLQCFHTFCKLCIKRHAELIDGANVFKCPKCLSETCLPQLSSVEELQPSLLHSRMVNILAFLESEKVCSVSGSHSSASWHCFDCDRSLCDECEKIHSVFTKDHKVVSLVETKEGDVKLMLRRETNCVHHVDETELFCEDCERAICFKCLQHGHERHLTISMTKHTSAKKALMSEQLEQLKQQKETMQKQFKLIEEANIELKETCDKAKQRLKERLQEVIETLQKNAEELMSQIDETLEKAEKRKVKGQSTLDQTQGAIDYVNKLIENGLASELIEYEIKKENSIICDDITVIQHVGIVFDSNEELMKQVNVGLGTLRTVELTDPTMSGVEVECELEAAKKAKLVVLTKSQTGKLTDDQSDVIDVKIFPENDVKIKEKYVRKEGKIEVEFMAKVPGQLTAEVKVNGNHLSNSPLVMNVKPQKMRKTRQFNRKGVDTGSFRRIAVNKENSRIAVADDSARCVHVFNTDGDLLLTYGSHGSGQGQLSRPEGLAFLNETDLVISDCGNHKICIVNTTTGTLVKSFGNQGNGDGEFCYPRGVHVDDDGNIILSDQSNHRVQVFTKDGDYQYKFGLTKQDRFDPVSTVTHRGLFYVSDYNNDVIHVFEKKGNVPTRISMIGGQGNADGQLSGPRGLAIDNDHNLLVCDCGNNRIQKFTSDGRFVGKTCDEIKYPLYIAVLNDGHLLGTCFGSGVFYVE